MGETHPPGLCTAVRVGKVAMSSWPSGGRVAGPSWGRRKSTDGERGLNSSRSLSGRDCPQQDKYRPDPTILPLLWMTSCTTPPTRGVGSLFNFADPSRATLRDQGCEILKSRPALVVITPHMLAVETCSKASNGPQAPHRGSASGKAPARPPPRIRDCVVSRVGFPWQGTDN